MNRRALIANIVIVQALWFACVLDGARGPGWLGPLLVLPSVLGHAWFAANRRLELATAGWALVIGLAVDSLLGATGVVSYPRQAAVPPPLFMLALWANFACTLGWSMRFLNGRYLLAAALGAIGGPLAYVGGTHFGTLAVVPWHMPRFALLVVAWAAAMPLLLAGRAVLSRRLAEARPTPPANPEPAKEST